MITVMKRGWLIAVAAASVLIPHSSARAQGDAAPLHTFHCLHGCPVGAPASNDTIVREIYTLSANRLTKFADWVAYRITPETIAKSKAIRNWQTDPWLAPSETLTAEDYAGASEALGIDRGHQAPLAAFSGTKTWSDTNILSNITPQASALNQGAWQRLEARENQLSKAAKTSLYVLTGPLYERLMRGMPGTASRHRVPSGYWKVIATPNGQASAFIFDQNTARAASYRDMRAPMEEVVLRSRLELFPGPSTPAFVSLDAALGCEGPMPLRPPAGEIAR
jgi:endonuclease G